MGRRLTSAALLLVGFLALQAAWIAVVPPFGGVDEIDHVYRAASVARGEWVAGAEVRDGRGQAVRVPESIVRAARPLCLQHRSFGADNCEGRPVGGSWVVVGSGAGSYNPVFYAVAGLPSLVLDARGALYGMRALCALLCALLVGAAACCLTHARGGPLPLVGMVVAMTPTFAYSTALVAPNGIEMAAGLLLWCALLTAGATDSRHEETLTMAAATVAASVLVTTRSLGPLFCVLIVALVALARHRDLVALLRRRPAAAGVCALVVTMATAASLWWILTARPLGSGDAAGAGPDASRWLVLRIVPTGILQAIAAFPFRDDGAPLLVYPVYALAVLALFVAAIHQGRGGPRLALVGTWVLSLAVPVAITWATFSSNGLAWQGRYGLPLSVGGCLLAGWILREALPTALVSVVPVACAAVAGVVSVAGVAVLRQRGSASLVTPGSTTAWLVLGGAVLLAALGFVACAAAVMRARAD